MPNDLHHLRATWDALGKDDPLWAILSRPDKRGGRWDSDEFFAAGEIEIAAIQAFCEQLSRPSEHHLAVDFGCGVGRLTRALASRYDHAVGIDISPSMLEQARSANAHLANVRFVENAEPRLDFLADGSVDLVYSVITLHHMPAHLQRAYIAEFMRVVSNDGLAVFQIATGFSQDWRGYGYRLLPNAALAPLRRLVHASTAAAEMHVLAESIVADVASCAGKRILQAHDVDSAGRGFRGRMLWVG